MPKIFGIEHIIYICIFVIIMTASIVLVVKFIKTEKQINILMKAIGAVLLILIILNRIAISIREDYNWMYLIPDSFCGLCSFLFSFALLFGKKNNTLLHYVCYLGLIGGVANIVYPTYISQSDSFFYFATITGLLHHSVMVYGILLAYITKFFVPTFKKWYALPIGLACSLAFGEFLISALSFPDAFLIKEPIIKDSILTWYFLGALIIPASFIEMLIFDKVNKVVFFKKEN